MDRGEFYGTIRRIPNVTPRPGCAAP